LVRNTQLGPLMLHADSADRCVASSIKDEPAQAWATWAGRLQEYFHPLEYPFSPPRILVVGAASEKHRQSLPLQDTPGETVPPTLHNEAGIVGAAVLAHREEKALLKAARKAEKKADHKQRAKRDAAK